MHVYVHMNNYCSLSLSLPLQKAAGLWGSLLIIFGVIGATLSGVLISRTKLYKEIGMVCLFCTILTLICFVEVKYMQLHVNTVTCTLELTHVLMYL